MNKLLVFSCVIILFSCSQKRFAFRQKVKAGKEPVASGKTVPARHRAVTFNPVEEPQTGPGPTTVSVPGHRSLQASSTRKEITASRQSPLPGKPAEIAPKEKIRAEESLAKPAQPAKPAAGGFWGYISLAFGLLGVIALLSLVFVTSNMLGTILLFSAPVLGTLALVAGILSVGNNDGKEFGWAGIALGCLLLLLTLVMVMVAYLFIQSSLSMNL